VDGLNEAVSSSGIVASSLEGANTINNRTTGQGKSGDENNTIKSLTDSLRQMIGGVGGGDQEN
jgi:hypothetical protein